MLRLRRDFCTYRHLSAFGFWVHSLPLPKYLDSNLLVKVRHGSLDIPFI